MVLNAIQTVLMVFLILAIGYIMCMKGIIVPQKHSLMLSKLIIYIAMPCMLFNSMMVYFTQDMLAHSFWYFFTSLSVQLAVFGAAYLIAPLLRLARNRRGLFSAMSALSNTMFVGLPVCIGIFGEQAIPYVLFYYAMNTVVFWTFANYALSKDAGKATKLISLSTLKSVFSPPLLVFLLSLPFIALRIQLPELIMSTTKTVGAMATPLSIIFVGIVIYQAGFASLKPDKPLTVMVLFRTLISPIATYIVARAVGLAALPAQVLTIQSAMPVMTSCVVVAELLGADTEYAMRGVVLTTLLSLLLIPLYMAVLPLL